MTTPLHVETHACSFGGHVLLLRFERPDARNAISRELLAALEERIAALSADRSARALILTGSGAAFCSGADLKERATMAPDEVRDFLTRTNRLFRAIETLPLPVVAAINGFALGGGLELALCCDLRLTVPDAQLGLTETSLGIIPGAGGTQRLSRAIGLPRAKELIFTGKRVSGTTAAELGLVHAVHAPEQLVPAAIQLAVHDIGRNAPIALAQAKRALNEGYETDLESGLAIERACYEVTIPTRDRVEALTAFREKRPPVFRGE